MLEDIITHINGIRFHDITVHGVEAITILKRIAANVGDGVRNADAGQTAAASKRAIFDGCDRVGDGQVGQASAVRNRKASEADEKGRLQIPVGDGVPDVDTGQLRAIVKRTFANIGDRVRNIEAGQVVTV